MSPVSPLSSSLNSHYYSLFCIGIHANGNTPKGTGLPRQLEPMSETPSRLFDCSVLCVPVCHSILIVHVYTHTSTYSWATVIPISDEPSRFVMLRRREKKQTT